ncbi:hypothetical protein EDD21DRAFT_374660 [Dissophora ornata]|nr:hypothetical protein EDD21DRAFT_374660 [Dissophora ornata]
MQPDLNKVRVASSPEELTTLWNAFKNKFPQACSVITYIEKNWMTAEKISKWASFVRQDYQHVDTNNLIESWRNTLKKRHLGSERNVRADFLIYLLQEVTNTDFRIAYYKIRQGLQPLQLSEYDRERRAKAMALDFDTARNMVTEKMDERKFLVKSFTQPGAEYSVFVDMNRVLLLSCSCEDYVQQKLPCKHMYLVPRVYVDLEIKYGGDPILPQEPQETQEAIGVGQDFEPPLGSTLSPHLVLQLQATRAEHQEAQKRAREEEIAEAFQECEHELLVACEELIDVVILPKRGSGAEECCARRTGV